MFYKRVLLISLLPALLVTAYVVGADRQIVIAERYKSPLFSPDGKSLLINATLPVRDEEILLLNADGTGLHNLTQNPADDNSPSWSPDGNSILFCSDRDGTNSIFTMNPDGSDVTKIADATYFIALPSWSPDGNSILFNGNEGVTISAADGNRLHVLAPNGQDPIWSPDGKWILYWIFPKWEMRIVSVDGSGDHKIGSGQPITWTPDGNGIFYLSPWVKDKPQNIYRMKADGSATKIVLKNVTLVAIITSAHRLWSPDGSHLALALGSEGKRGIVILNPEGRVIRDFRKADWFIYDPNVSWRDDHTLAFSRFYLSPRIESTLREEYGGIYIMNTDTGKISRLLKDKAVYTD